MSRRVMSATLTTWTLYLRLTLGDDPISRSSVQCLTTASLYSMSMTIFFPTENESMFRLLHRTVNCNTTSTRPRYQMSNGIDELKSIMQKPLN